jgi:hypothetical protein
MDIGEGLVAKATVREIARIYGYERIPGTA